MGAFFAGVAVRVYAIIADFKRADLAYGFATNADLTIADSAHFSKAPAAAIAALLAGLAALASSDAGAAGELAAPLALAAGASAPWELTPCVAVRAREVARHGERECAPRTVDLEATTHSGPLLNRAQR